MLGQLLYILEPTKHMFLILCEVPIHIISFIIIIIISIDSRIYAISHCSWARAGRRGHSCRQQSHEVQGIPSLLSDIYIYVQYEHSIIQRIYTVVMVNAYCKGTVSGSNPQNSPNSSCKFTKRSYKV